MLKRWDLPRDTHVLCAEDLSHDLHILRYICAPILERSHLLALIVTRDLMPNIT